MYYVFTDHLGSYDKIYNDGGTKVEEYSFDAWGRRRNPTNWTFTGSPAHNFTNRGFTGHEHIDEFDLINMNGRCYDPNIGRFLSPDNYVQMPDFTQNFNRYAYCLNNPLKYTDPSGDFILEALTILAFTYSGGVLANVMYGIETDGNPFNPGDWNWHSGSTYLGMVSGGINGASVAGVPLPSLFPTQPSILLEGTIEAGKQVFINGVINSINGDQVFDNWYWAAARGFIAGGAKGGLLAHEIGLSGMDVFYCNLDKRAQAWANYFEMDGFSAKIFNKDRVELVNSNPKRLHNYYYSDGDVYYYDEFNRQVNVDGLYSGNGTAYFSKAVIRQMRPDGGWAKGTMYHEYSHFRGKNEDFAYMYGLKYGGRSYYKKIHRHGDYLPNDYSYYMSNFGYNFYFGIDPYNL